MRWNSIVQFSHAGILPLLTHAHTSHQGRSQDRIDGTGAEERGRTGIIARRDIQEHRMLRVEGSRRHGVGKNIMLPSRIFFVLRP